MTGILTEQIFISYCRYRVIESSSLISVLFKEVFSYLYISFFHLLVYTHIYFLHILYISVNVKLHLYVTGMPQWRRQDFFIGRAHSMEWDFAYKLLPIPPLSPCKYPQHNILGGLWHAPSEFFFTFRPHKSHSGAISEFFII